MVFAGSATRVTLEEDEGEVQSEDKLLTQNRCNLTSSEPEDHQVHPDNSEEHSISPEADKHEHERPGCQVAGQSSDFS